MLHWIYVVETGIYLIDAPISDGLEILIGWFHEPVVDYICSLSSLNPFNWM